MRDIDAGESATLVFEAPADFGKPFDCEDTGSKSKIEFIDDRNTKFGTYYTVKQNYDASKKFLSFSSAPTVVCFSYVAKPEEMSEDTDVTLLPEQYGTRLLALIVAGGLLYGTYGDDALGIRGKNLLAKGYSELASFYSKYALKTKETRKTVKRKPWNVA